MSVTINDVAKHAGVSIKTVSRVINKEPSVRKTTFDKVMASVRALNYQPNNAARNLAGTRSYNIGFIYDNPNAYYVIDMQNGILQECRAQGYELVIHPCQYSAVDIEEEITQLIRHSRIAGLVLTPPFSESIKVIELLEKLDVQFVRIISGEEKGRYASSCVFVNDHEAAYEITKHLIDLGHEKIGFLCGGEEHKSSIERLNGYQAALEDHQLKIDKRFILDGEYSFESGVKGAKKLLAKKERPSAIFASNDEMAAGALFAARLMNIVIPDELSIVGFEDSPFSRQTWPKLTTAHQPNKDIAQQASALLIGKIRQAQNSDSEAKGTVRSFSPELVVRDSSGPAH